MSYMCCISCGSDTENDSGLCNRCGPWRDEMYDCGKIPEKEREYRKQISDSYGDEQQDL